MIFTKEYMQPIFDLLEYTKGEEQGEKNHPEGDVYTHSLQCVNWAFKETVDTDVILAALCHDIGKAIHTIGHEDYSVRLCSGMLSAKSIWLIKHHLRIRDMYDGGMRKLKKVNYLLTSPWLPDLVHLSRIDKLGRNPNVQRLLTNEEVCGKLNMCVDKHFLINNSYKMRGGNGQPIMEVD